MAIKMDRERERERDVINKVINAVAFKHNHNVHLHSAQGVKSLIYNGYSLFQQHQQQVSERAQAAGLDWQLSLSSAACTWKIRHLISKHNKWFKCET